MPEAADAKSKNPEAVFEYLKTVENPSLEEYKLIAMLEAAGLDLYKCMADATPNEGVKKILARNGQEEMGHAHRLKRVIKAVWDEEWEIPSSEENPYRVDMTGVEITPKFLTDFADVEFSGEEFYENWASKLGHPEAERLLRQNGKEETRHGERLREAAQLL